MYNLTVAIAHTFFVGEEQWLVHNTDCNKDTIDLYRAVGVEEFEHIMATGTFINAPERGTLEARQFALTMEEAEKFANTKPGRDTVAIIKVTIPSSYFDEFDFRDTIDTFIFKSGVLTVFEDKLKKFNDIVLDIKQVM